ncbi:MAG: sugar phosphate isomerase/epimerase [Rubripirellula sp.]|nr:sugar phosphate isomerase/epimerase [Rubripirellula sp.]
MHNPILNRRQLIAGVGTTATSLGLPACAQTPVSDSGNGLSLTFSTYGLPKHPLQKAIDEIANAGYDGIEICVAPNFNTAAEKLTPQQRKRARQQLQQRGLKVASLMAHLQPLGSAEQHQRDLERLKTDCELACELSPNNPPVIQTVLGGKSWRESQQMCRDRLAEWVKIAAEHGVVIAVKPHRGHAMSRPSEAAWVIEQLGAPKSLRMWYDFSHFLFRDMTLPQTINDSLPILAGVAVKDAIKEGNKVRFLLPGAAGTIDYKLLCSLLYDGGFRGSICVEVSSQVWKQPGYDATQALKESYGILSSAMAASKIPRPE